MQGGATEALNVPAWRQNEKRRARLSDPVWPSCCGEKEVFTLRRRGFFLSVDSLVTAAVKLARKHTKHITRDFPRLVQGAVGRLIDR